MNFNSIMKEIVGNVLGTKNFKTDDSGHLMLTEEQKTKLNETFKSKDGKFADTFVESWNQEADNSKEGSSVDSIATEAMIATIRKDAISELAANQSQINEALQAAAQELAATKKDLSEKEKTIQLVNEELAKEKQSVTELQGKVNTLSAKTETDQGITIEKTGMQQGKKDFKANTKHFHNEMATSFLGGDPSKVVMAQFTGGYIDSKNMSGVTGQTIDVQELNEEFGVYLSDNSRRMKIFKEILPPTKTRDGLTVVLAIEEWRDAKAKITSVIQPYIALWTPTGKTTITPLKIVNRRHKLNVPIIPDNITGGWLTYLYNEEVTPDQMPVTKYVIEQLLRPQIAIDLEYKMIMKGKYVELPDGIQEGDAGQAPESGMDGFITQLQAQAALGSASKMNRFVPDGYSFSYDNSVKFFEDYVAWIKETNSAIAAAGGSIDVDPSMYELYQKKYREMFPNTKNEDANKALIDFSNFSVNLLENMRGTGCIFFSPKANKIELRHLNEAGGQTRLFLQLHNYEVRVFGEFWFAVGFAVAEWVFYYLADETSGSGA
jgi:hypothetical protein